MAPFVECAARPPPHSEAVEAGLMTVALPVPKEAPPFAEIFYLPRRPYNNESIPGQRNRCGKCPAYIAQTPHKGFPPPTPSHSVTYFFLFQTRKRGAAMTNTAVSSVC